MAFFDENFGRQIVRRAAETVRLLSFVENFSQAEVSQGNVSIFVHENVFWLQISVDNFLVVQMADSQGDLKGVKLGAIFVESLGCS